MKSDSLKIGTQNAPHRALYHALGLTEEEIERPLVGIVSSYNEIVPGHMNIDKIVDAVKIGVAMAGGTPIVFPAIAVCDGIAMGHTGMKYSLVTRDLIADSTEAMALAHGFDALVMVPNCDKNVPGLLMAAARLNVPTVFVSGGPMLAGHVDGAKTSFSSKCDLAPDKIVCSGSDLYLFFGNKCVNVGHTNLEERIMQISPILEKLGDQGGTLYLENFNTDNITITFEKDVIPDLGT